MLLMWQRTGTCYQWAGSAVGLKSARPHPFRMGHNRQAAQSPLDALPFPASPKLINWSHPFRMGHRENWAYRLTKVPLRFRTCLWSGAHKNRAAELAAVLDSTDGC